MNPSARWKHPLDRDAFSPGEVERDLGLVLDAWVEGLAMFDDLDRSQRFQLKMRDRLRI